MSESHPYDKLREHNRRLNEQITSLLTKQDALREAVTALKPFYRETRQQVEGLTRKMPPELQTEYLTRFKRADEALAAIPTPNRKAS